MALLSVEGDEQVGRVTRLHSAAIGYTSVIFGNIYGEIEMIDTWREVWQNLEKDNSLPQKLVILRHSNTQKILIKKLMDADIDQFAMIHFIVQMNILRKISNA